MAAKRRVDETRGEHHEAGKDPEEVATADAVVIGKYNVSQARSRRVNGSRRTEERTARG